MNFRVRWQRAVAVSLAAALPLSAVAAYRYASTGRFALSQESAGWTILGSYIPGAASHGGWIDPLTYIASVRPDLVRDSKAMFAQTPRLALQEALRRPGFHAMRILSTILTQATEGEGASLYWSLQSPGVLPEALHQDGTALTTRLLRPLHLEMAAIQGLFLAAVIVGIRRRNTAILVLASAVLLKYGIHAFTAAHQGRYFFVATSWEMLAITVAIHEIWETVLPGTHLLVAGALGVGAAFSLGLILFAPHLAGFVRSRDRLEIGNSAALNLPWQPLQTLEEHQPIAVRKNERFPNFGSGGTHLVKTVDFRFRIVVL